jgi:hypothetical protein
MSKLLTQLDEILGETVRLAYRMHTAREPSQRSEYERRDIALGHIDEILCWRPLEAFKAEHLEFLVDLLGYWRELVGAEGTAEGPDSVQ